MKPISVNAQNTTSKRILCNVAQKYHWLKTYEEDLNLIRKNNTRVCPKKGKFFGEVIGNLVVGGDETNFFVDACGKLRIFGATENKKHDKRVSESHR